MNMLSAHGVSRVYGNDPNQVIALDNVDFHVAKAEMVAVMGPSGSGKSTLLTIVGGLEALTSGMADFNGSNLWALSAAGLAEVRRQQIGFVFQGFNLLTGLTAAENVATPLELDGTSAREARRLAMDCLGAGRARIIADPGDRRGLEPGAVLVAAITDSAWTPLFVSASCRSTVAGHHHHP